MLEKITGTPGQAADGSGNLLYTLSYMLGILTFQLPPFLLSVKRLHDFGWSGYRALGALIVTVLLVLVHPLLTVLCAVAYIALCALKPGTAGENKYGAAI